MEDILPVADIVRRLRELNPNGVPKWNPCLSRLHANEAARKWVEDNPEKRLKWSREYNQLEYVKAKHNIRKHERRALEMGCEGQHTAKQWELKKQAYDYKCAYCDIKLKPIKNNHPKQLTKDHIIPLAGGGTNNIENIVPACRKCNMSKCKSLLWFQNHHMKLPLPFETGDTV